MDPSPRSVVCRATHLRLKCSKVFELNTSALPLDLPRFIPRSSSILFCSRSVAAQVRNLDTNFHIASGTLLAPLGPSSLHIPTASPNFAYNHQNIYWGLSFLCSVLALAQQMESLLCELLAQLLVAVASLEEQSMVSLAVILQ